MRRRLANPYGYRGYYGSGFTFGALSWMRFSSIGIAPIATVSGTEIWMKPSAREGQIQV